MSDPVFAWEGKELPTVGDLSDAAFAIYKMEDKEKRAEKAQRFMEEYRAFTPHADQNIGYLTGYYGQDTMVGMLELFQTKHPVFGGPALAATVTGEQAFEMGKKWGEQMKDE